MRLELLDYELPESAIAQRPAERREMARLLVVGPDQARPEDRLVADWPNLVPPGALVVLNDTKVVSARLLGKKVKTGGKAELLLVERREAAPSHEPAGGPKAAPSHEPAGGPKAAPSHESTGSVERWRAVGKGLRELVGQELSFGEGALLATVEGASGVDGLYDIRLSTRGPSVARALTEHGHVPIPPYIRRPDDAADAERYQTVYARAPGAIAAPTAGLHLTTPMLDALSRRNVRIAYLTLHVGLGTFQPIAAADLDDHPMHAEVIDVPDALVREVAEARARETPVVAVGTTVVRALESAADPDRPGHIAPKRGETRILIQPGFHFRVVDALLTNFHLPRSTLLALVAAFAGRTRILGAYRDAVQRGYRFYSYGDAMWIPARLRES